MYSRDSSPSVDCYRHVLAQLLRASPILTSRFFRQARPYYRIRTISTFSAESYLLIPGWFHISMHVACANLRIACVLHAIPFRVVVAFGLASVRARRKLRQFTLPRASMQGLHLEWYFHEAIVFLLQLQSSFPRVRIVSPSQMWTRASSSSCLGTMILEPGLYVPS